MGRRKVKGNCPRCGMPLAEGAGITWDEQAYAQRHTVCPARENRPKRRRVGRNYTKAGPVTITRPDGTTDAENPYSPAALRAITKERHPITARVKDIVAARDRTACRYCHTTAGPFEYDHVIPVADGGPTSVRNLVLACTDCNRRKGTHRWTPKPIHIHYTALDNAAPGADLPAEQDENVGPGTRSEHKGAAKQPS